MFHFSQVYFCNTYLFNSFAAKTVLPAHAASSHTKLLEPILQENNKWNLALVMWGVSRGAQSCPAGAIPQARFPSCLSHSDLLTSTPALLPPLWYLGASIPDKFGLSGAPGIASLSCLGKPSLMAVLDAQFWPPNLQCISKQRCFHAVPCTSQGSGLPRLLSNTGIWW